MRAAEFTAPAAFKGIACHGSPRKARALQRAAAIKLQRRVARNIGTERPVVTVRGAIDGVKMSEVLEDFVDPYMRFTTGLASAKQLYMTALVAWNVALLAPGVRRAQLDRALATLKLDSTGVAEMRVILLELVERKDRLFSQYKRMVLDFELTDAGSDYHLSVVSSGEPMKPPA